MGGIVDSVFGGGGDGGSAGDAARQAQELNMTGFNYLTHGTSGDQVQDVINQGLYGGQLGNNALNLRASLLGVQLPQQDGAGGSGVSHQYTPPGDSTAATSGRPAGFQNYLNSTGYQFAKNQGLGAINGNAAASGMLDSGATLKALNNYGQGLAAQRFDNYLAQLTGVGQAGYNRQSQGSNMLGTVAGTGTKAGIAAGDNAILEGNAETSNNAAIGSILGAGAGALFGVPGMGAGIGSALSGLF